MGHLILCTFDFTQGVWVYCILDNYFLVDSLVNHVSAHTAPLEVFPIDYEALTTFINTNANNLAGSQLLTHFDYNGAAVLEPYARQGLVEGIDA